MKELLHAEDILARTVTRLHEEFEEEGHTWTREKVAHNVSERATLIKARGILLDRTEKANH